MNTKEKNNKKNKEREGIKKLTKPSIYVPSYKSYKE